MSSFGKSLVASVLVSVFGFGCAPKRGTASPGDYYQSVQLALEGGRVAAMIGRNQALSEKNFAGCVASDVVASALKSGEGVLRGKLADEPQIPGFELDLSECLALRDEQLPPATTEETAALVQAVAGVALAAVHQYAEKLKASDCRKGVAVLAVEAYVAGMAVPVAAELAAPDGKFAIDAVFVDLASCEAP